MNRLAQYRSYQADTAGPEERVVLLYDAVRRFVDQALLALERRNYEAVAGHTAKAQQILTELSVALNFDAGDIATNLAKLYEYWSWRLSQGLIHRDAQAFGEVSAMVSDMHLAWAEAAKQVRAQRASVQSIG